MAARYEITEQVKNTDGRAVAGLSGTVNDLTGAALTIYTTESGATTTTNPLTSNSNGQFAGWVEAPDYDLVVTGSGYTADPTTLNVRTSPPGVFNVKSYGAVGDGVADDTTTLQSAIAACAAAGGGIVVCPPGTIIGNWTLPTTARVLVVGMGAATTFKSKAGSNGDVFKTEGFAALTGTDSSGGNWRSGIRDCVVDGNKANNAGGYGIRLYGWKLDLQNVIVQNCDNDGIWTEWGADVAGADVDTQMEASFCNIVSMNNGGNGWTFYGPHDSQIVNYVGKQNTGWGFINGYSAGDYNGQGAHAWGLNTWNNDAGGIKLTTGLSGTDVATSAGAAKQALLIDTGAGPCVIDNLNAGAGTGVEVKSADHRLTGIIQNCTTEGLKINGAFGCVFDLIWTNNAKAISFTSDAGANTIRGVVHDTTGSQIIYDTADFISVADSIDLIREGSGESKLYQRPRATATVATDAAFALTPGTSSEHTLHTGTLSADRAVTLSTTGARKGQTFKITRSGGGAFNLNVGTGPLKALATNTWAEFIVDDGGTWRLAQYGAL